MADNPRELIRAAQAAELQGDMTRAADCLEQAAALYQKSGHTSRASQLLRQARQLKSRSPDVSPAFAAAMAAGKDAVAFRSLSSQPWSDAVSPGDPSPSSEPDPAVLHPSGRHDAVAPGVTVSTDAKGLPRLAQRIAAVGAGSPSKSSPQAPASEAPLRSEPEPEDNNDDDDDEDVILPGGLLRPLDEDEGPVPPAPERGRRREKRLIERGPTRADPALDAWCSFCCRPRGEVGDLVAGPAGAFICKGCLGESQGLLGDVVPPPVRKPVESPEPTASVEMVGHDEVRILLERTLQAGARCLLLVGPEGCGKSIFFQTLERRGQGVLTTVESLESASGMEPLLLEDVDRLTPGAQAALVAFIASHPERAVVMSARGAVSSLGLWVRGEGGSLPVPTTAGLTEAVQGSIPVALLERVQVLLPVRRPTVPELVEVARRSLALRRPVVSLSEEVLGAFAAEAVRSPRAGHELRALLSRVYAGTWSLESAQTPAAPNRGGRKGPP
ncbi:ClpX C4-type zinc finger protein [Corallococcus sicarius]|uniref:ClpX-type ZB domain-containing protein n=1 Tax=Corallococcus sicarius TaxID=2316726 RepID=A0A3A8NEJ7_9BACT|nr:ClpX C4-type zinc finger protein [Corallococcus sicarius]RKH40641.1 hypothetical protein D7X12_20215 [Corallococcus sicarius]